jgi:hypothetical protein
VLGAGYSFRKQQLVHTERLRQVGHIGRHPRNPLLPDVQNRENWVNFPQPAMDGLEDSE